MLVHIGVTFGSEKYRWCSSNIVDIPRISSLWRINGCYARVYYCPSLTLACRLFFMPIIFKPAKYIPGPAQANRTTKVQPGLPLWLTSKGVNKPLRPHWWLILPIKCWLCTVFGAYTVVCLGSSVEWILSDTQDQWIFGGKTVGQGERAYAASTADGRKQFGRRKAVTVYSRRWTGQRVGCDGCIIGLGLCGFCPPVLQQLMLLLTTRKGRCVCVSWNDEDVKRTPVRRMMNIILLLRNIVTFLCDFYHFLDHLRPSHLCLNSSTAYTHNCCLTVHYLLVYAVCTKLYVPKGVISHWSVNVVLHVCIA